MSEEVQLDELEQRLWNKGEHQILYLLLFQSALSNGLQL